MFRELRGVREEVEEGLPDLGHVRRHNPGFWRALKDEDVAVLLDQRRHHRFHAVQQAGDVELLDEDGHPPGFDLREVEDVVDEHELVLGRLVDLRQVGNVGVIAEVFRFLGEQLAVADDGVQRRPQFVGHAGQELGLVAGGDLELPRWYL